MARYEQGDHVAVWRELFALGQLPDDALRREAAACFEWGGFPRLERASLSEKSRRFLDDLCRELLPF